MLCLASHVVAFLYHVFEFKMLHRGSGLTWYIQFLDHGFEIYLRHHNSFNALEIAKKIIGVNSLLGREVDVHVVFQIFLKFDFCSPLS